MHIQQAYKLLAQGQLEQALALCESLIHQDPGFAKALILMSAIQQKLDNRQAATQSLVKAAALQSDDTTALLGTIKALRTIGALDEARALLDRLDGNSLEVLIGRAQVQWQDGEYGLALAGFESAFERWPQRPETALALARALLRLTATERASQVLQQAAQCWPHNAEVNRLRAVLELDLGRPGHALNHLLPHGNPGPAAGPPAAGGLAEKMRVALQCIEGQSDPGILGSGDVLDRSFDWIRQHSRNPRWFGTNSALLGWASGRVPDCFPAEGPVVECGVFHGFSLRLLANLTQRPVHGFDSFAGLPEKWKSGEPAGSYSTHGRMPATAGHVQLHQGWFEETLPVFAAQLASPIALLHVDCDLYSSTRTVLQHLGPHLATGSLLVFDDFLAYEGFEEHVFRAAQEYFSASRQRFELVGAVLLGRAVAFRLKES